jgi:hypothetical protein
VLLQHRWHLGFLWGFVKTDFGRPWNFAGVPAGVSLPNGLAWY